LVLPKPAQISISARSSLSGPRLSASQVPHSEMTRKEYVFLWHSLERTSVSAHYT
jgi:hypothetical protein